MRRHLIFPTILAGALALTACNGESKDNPSGAVSASATASQHGTPNSKKTGFAPHFNGLYVSKEVDSNGTPTRDYIRFFKDGTVCVVPSSGNANDVRRWLKPGDPHTPDNCDPGALSGSAFTQGGVSFKVIASGADTFTTRSKSSMTGNVATRHFVFSAD